MKRLAMKAIFGIAAMAAILLLPAKEAQAHGCCPNIATESTQSQIKEEMKNIYKYLSSGEGGGDGGLIAAVGQVLEGIKANMKVDGQGRAETDQRLRKVFVESKLLEEERQVRSVFNDAAACADIGAGAAGVGGIASSAKGKAMAESSIAALKGGSVRYETEHSASVYAKRKDSGYCSEQDAKNPDGTPRNAFGCSAEGTMPDADARAQSMFQPAVKHTGAVPEQTGYTYDDDNGTMPKGPSKAKGADSKTGAQKQAAYDAMSNIVAAYSPTRLMPEIEKSVAGRNYLTKVKVANARISPAEHALAGIIGRRDGSGNDGAKMASVDWDEQSQKVYATVFNGAPRPKQPSELEFMRFETYRRFAGKDWQQEMANNSDQGKFLRELNKMGAVELAMLWNMNLRLEEGNAILSSILAQSMNPVSKEELKALADAAQKR